MSPQGRRSSWQSFSLGILPLVHMPGGRSTGNEAARGYGAAEALSPRPSFQFNCNVPQFALRGNHSFSAGPGTGA